MIKERSELPTIAVGLITEAKEAEEILTRGDSDLVAIGRAILYDPRWPWHAAEALGAEMTVPPQYLRGHAPNWPGARLARPEGGHNKFTKLSR